MLRRNLLFFRLLFCLVFVPYGAFAADIKDNNTPKNARVGETVRFSVKVSGDVSRAVLKFKDVDVKKDMTPIIGKNKWELDWKFNSSGEKKYEITIYNNKGKKTDDKDGKIQIGGGSQPPPSPSPPTPPAVKCPGGNGLYCGDSGKGQNPAYLYQCTNGSYSLKTVCSNGCQQNAAGKDDSCKAGPTPPPPTPPAACPGGNGLYCGDSGKGQNPAYLYQCTNGSYSLKTACSNGCQQNAAGKDDSCKGQDGTPIPPPMPGGNHQPNLNNLAYSAAGGNPFAIAGYGGQCTAFAWGRALEMTGQRLDTTKNGKYWYDQTKYPKGHSPKAKSIAVWGGDSRNQYGHVAFVEEVNGNSVIINEANFSKYKDSNFGGGYDGSPKTLSQQQMASRSGAGKLLGYIYLNNGGAPQDNDKPRIHSFGPNKPNIKVGETVEISFTVSDTGGSGLRQVELWRGTEIGKLGPIQKKPLNGNGPISGKFTDSPSTAGTTYYFGIHVLDNNNNQTNDEGAKPVVVIPDSKLTGSVSGSVHKNSAGGSALSEATVTCGGKVATTDGSGKFMINGIAAGNHEIVFFKSGYETYKTTVPIKVGQSYSVGHKWLAEYKPVIDNISMKTVFPLPDIFKSKYYKNGLCGPLKLTHTGVDIMTSHKEPEVKSICKGQIVFNNTTINNYINEYDKYWNPVLIIAHDCNEDSVVDFYAHYGHVLSSKGGSVAKGDPIGKIRQAYKDGNVPDPNNNHLHLSIKKTMDNDKWGYVGKSCEDVKKDGWMDPLKFIN